MDKEKTTWWVIRRAEGNGTLSRICDRFIHKIDLLTRLDIVNEFEPKVVYS